MKGEKWGVPTKQMKKHMLKDQMKLIQYKMQKLEQLQKEAEADPAALDHATEEVAAMGASLEGVEILVVSEHAGRQYFGKVAEVVEVENDEALVNFHPGLQRLPANCLADAQTPLKQARLSA